MLMLDSVSLNAAEPNPVGCFWHRGHFHVACGLPFWLPVQQLKARSRNRPTESNHLHPSRIDRDGERGSGSPGEGIGKSSEGNRG